MSRCGSHGSLTGTTMRPMVPAWSGRELDAGGPCVFRGSEAQFALLIHEYGHHYCGDHLCKDFYRALAKLGARMTMLALDKPEVFHDRDTRDS